MYRINDSATAVSRKELHKLTNPIVELDSDWLAALKIWADDPDMILILQGPTLNRALANLGKASPAMAAAQMVLRHLRELTNFQVGPRGDAKTPANMKMKTELVNTGPRGRPTAAAESEFPIRKLWVWHKD
jgi:hypothetical protein